jgi:hypothetical protein
MKVRHNKKRNTAFVYEALVREATSLILKKDISRSQIIKKLIQKHFGENSLLKRDLDCYRALSQDQSLHPSICNRILQEVKIANRLIDPDGLFKQQTAIIHDINKDVSSDVFNNFVPNYRSLATIAQLFSPHVNPKTRVMLENQILQDMCRPTENLPKEPVDNVVYATFVEKFNDKYTGTLLPEQKELLSRYITSFADNGVSLKIFLNEEIGKLKKEVSAALATAEIKEDPEMQQKTQKVMELLESFKTTSLDDQVLLKIMKIQQLAKEINHHGDND